MLGLQALFFYIFALITVGAALMVVFSRNPVHSVLFLILTFVSAAGLFLLTGAEFLALILIVVYVGAVAILFLFVVMMLDLNFEELRVGFWKHFPLAAVVGVIIALELALVLGLTFQDVPAPPALTGEAAANYSNTKELGILLYTEYLYPLEVAAVLLLVGMIAAIALTLRGRKDSKHVNPSQQVHVRARDRVALVKVDATGAALPPAPSAAVEESKA